MISEEDLTLLSAYQDGELADEDLSRLRERLLKEPELRRELDAIRDADEMLAGFARQIDQVPVPERISALVRANPAQSAVKLFGAAAAVFVLTVGSFLMSPDTSIDYAMLDELESGERLLLEGDYIEVIATFRQLDGRYCREFMTSTSHRIACRTGAEWRTMVEVSRQELPAGSYQPAGAGLTAIDHYVRDHISGTPLEAATEKNLIDHHWR